MSFICGSNAGGDGAIRVLAKLVDCCIGSANGGPGACTCWEVEYDQEQTPPGEPAVEVWPSMCDDCAYRPDSPERQHDDRYVEPPDNGEPFWCHRGMRKVRDWRHPAGIFVEADGDYYAPPGRYLEAEWLDGRITRTAVPFQANGEPAKRCAGWAAHERSSS